MIPKVIHYCWFGENPLSDLAQKCICSWKKYCPEYEIKCWNENNINIDSVPYMKEAYEAKAWGFVPDVARLQIIYQEGGIYLDTDVEIIKSLDEVLLESAFMGFQDYNSVNLGQGFGAEPGNPVIKALLDDYNERHFKNSDGTFNRKASPYIQTERLKKMGLLINNTKQKVLGATILPSDYLCPISYETGRINIVENTLAIHHFDGTWLTVEEREWNKKRRKVMYVFGDRGGRFVWAGIRFIRKAKEIGFCNAIKLSLERASKK